MYDGHYIKLCNNQEKCRLNDFKNKALRNNVDYLKECGLKMKNQWLEKDLPKIDGCSLIIMGIGLPIYNQ